MAYLFLKALDRPANVEVNRAGLVSIGRAETDAGNEDDDSGGGGGGASLGGGGGCSGRGMTVVDVAAVAAVAAAIS